METNSLSRAQGSRLAHSATREAGLALTPSTDQALRTWKNANLGVRLGWRDILIIGTSETHTSGKYESMLIYSNEFLYPVPPPRPFLAPAGGRIDEISFSCPATH